MAQDQENMECLNIINRRERLVNLLGDELRVKCYKFFDFYIKPSFNPTLRGVVFDVAKDIRRDGRCGFLFLRRNYVADMVAEFYLKDPFKVEVNVFGERELDKLVSMTREFSEKNSLTPKTEFIVNLKSLNYFVCTTRDALNLNGYSA